ncbi:type I secretion system permease/ATPase [Rahnella bruchi]|uniref:type I secretion system permease/ATPase n=1 Tax=Rahnella bruchi TaxID=1510573 RepID=UPI000EA3C0FB|nr:type I secretion system permease/ATPase [Rahnella bruchi]
MNQVNQFARANDELLWAVQWIASHYHLSKSDNALYAGLPKGEKLTPQIAQRMLEQNGVRSAWVKRNIASIHDWLLPAVVATNDGHYVVLKKRDKKSKPAGWVIASAENGGGETTISEQQLSEIYNGYALFCSPQPTNREADQDIYLPAINKQGHWLFSVLWRYRQYFFSAALAALVANVLTLATTFFTMNVYDRVVPTQAFVTLWSLAVGVTIAIIFEFAARVIRARLIDNAGKKIDLVVGSSLFRQLMAINMEAKPASSGSFANQLREFESVRDFITSATLSTLSDLPFCLLFVFLIYLIGGPMVMAPLVAMALILLLSVIIQWPMARKMKENLREISMKQGLLIQTIEGLESIKAVGGEGVMQKRWDDYSALASASSMQSKILSGLTLNAVSLIQQLASVAIVVMGVYLITAGELTMGGMIGAVILSGRAVAPLAAVVGLTLRYQQAKAALSSLNLLMAMPLERDEQRNYLSLSHLKGDISLKGVEFCYPVSDPRDARQTLKDVTLTIKQGERVGIIGNIGSGKSTLLKVLARLYTPGKGSLLLNQLDCSQIDPADWRTAVGYVGQDNRLFSGTLRENITLGKPNASHESILAVANMTGVDRIAASHPRGYEMPVGEMGQNLSGGQKQLVSLARSLLLQPQILLMDEPTSSMDAMSEMVFINYLKRALSNQTLIVVTHRFSLLEIVDRLIVIDDGKIVADGEKNAVIEQLNK